MTELRTIITLRQGTTAQWAESQVILKQGEVGLEYCGDGLVKIKAGDGKHLWSGLSYVNKDVHDALIAEIERASAAEVALGNRITKLEGINHEAYIAADTALKNELVEAINLKADKTALEGAVSDLNDAIALKADAADLEAAVEALDDSISKTEGGLRGEIQEAANQAASDLEAAKDELTNNLSLTEGGLRGEIQEVANKAEGDLSDAMDTLRQEIENTAGGLQISIDEKANAADVYTKDEIGTITEGKTLVEMIEAAKSEATYNDAEVRGLISDNADAIAEIDATLKAAIENEGEGLDSIKELATWIEEHGKDAAEMTAAIEANAAAIAAADRSIKINSGKIDDNAAAIAANAEAIADNADQIKADGEAIAANAAAIAVNAKAIADEAARADAAEKANAAAIKAIADDYLKAADKTALSDAIAAEAETARAAEAANAKAIAAIYAVDGEAKSGVLVNEISRVEGLITDAITTAANDASVKDAVVLASAQEYTDDAIAGLPAATAEALGLVKYDDATIKMNESKQLYVAKVSTDVLEMGTNILVLNGGSATAE